MKHSELGRRQRNPMRPYLLRLSMIYLNKPRFLCISIQVLRYGHHIADITIDRATHIPIGPAMESHRAAIVPPCANGLELTLVQCVRFPLNGSTKPNDQKQPSEPRGVSSLT